jgi:hypothetical protein
MQGGWHHCILKPTSSDTALIEENDFKKARVLRWKIPREYCERPHAKTMYPSWLQVE